MKKIIKISLLVLLISLVVLVVSGFLLSGFTVFNNSTQLISNERSPLSNSINRLVGWGFDLESFDSKYIVDTISIKSSWDDHRIPANYISIDGNRNRSTVIIVHGLGGNRMDAYPIAVMFLEQGYNVLAYDQRSSGENDALYTTYGYWESRDLVDYTNYLGSIISDNNVMILHGTSFGGATVAIALGNNLLNEKVRLAILDSPLSSMRTMIDRSMSAMDVDIPERFIDFMLSAGDVVTNLKLGFDYDDAEAVNHISKTKLPVLIFGAEADAITPFYMCEDIFGAISHENKMLFTDKDAKHAQMFFKDKALYKETIFSFIEKYLKS